MMMMGSVMALTILQPPDLFQFIASPPQKGRFQLLPALELAGKEGQQWYHQDGFYRFAA